jgi:hypothetical protein
VSGTTVGQWARRGYIRSSVSSGHPHVYSLEDVVEAAFVRALLERGVRRAEVRRAVERLAPYGPWPLSDAPLATTDGGGRAHVVLEEPDGIFALGEHGWQLMTAPPALRAVRPRFRRTAGDVPQRRRRRRASNPSTASPSEPSA